MASNDQRRVAARRTATFGTSIFSEITALANAHGAVNLGQGFPDFPAPAFELIVEGDRKPLSPVFSQPLSFVPCWLASWNASPIDRYVEQRDWRR